MKLTAWDTCDFKAAVGVMMDAVVVLIRLIGPFSMGEAGTTFAGKTSRSTGIPGAVTGTFNT